MEYALIKTGTVHNVIVADDDFIALIAADWEHIEPLDTAQEQALGVGIGWGWDGVQFTAPSAPELPAAPPDRRITKLAFRNRFTGAEKVAVEIAALDDPAAAMPQRQQAAMLRAYVRDLDNATFIDLTRADTRAGVQMLESAGILAAGRALTILDGPVADIERYQG